MKQYICVAMRGRPIVNPSLRIAGLLTEQRLEPNFDGINTLSTVCKDNMILEIEQNAQCNILGV